MGPHSPLPVRARPVGKPGPAHGELLLGAGRGFGGAPERWETTENFHEELPPGLGRTCL